MDAPAVLYALRWLIHDTFRQALTSRVFWIMLALSGLCILFCLGVSVEGGTSKGDAELIDPKGQPIAPQTKDAPGRISFLFGVFPPVPFARSAAEQVHFLLSIFASWVAGTAGILMALVWTSGFLAEALQPSTASVLLAKPVPRWLLLTGKYLGVVCFVGLQATIFFVGTWMAIGVKTNIWVPEYLLGVPLLVFQFAVIYSFTVMLAVLFRSTMACMVGGVLFWIICCLINYARHTVVVYGDLNPGGPPLSEFTVFLADVGYWLLPKPLDITIMLEQSMQLGEVKMTLSKDPQLPFARMLQSEQFHPVASVLTSCLFPVFALWAAGTQLAKTDY
jgi:ABC-type transport system involved in multi-copper enzyme maturation permease subunit